MQRKKETRPISRQARERVHKSNHSVSQEAICVAIVAALFLFVVLAVPQIMYDFIAPMKGWV